MTRRPPSTVRRMKIVLGTLIVCRALIAMHAAAIGPTSLPIDAAPCAGLLRATRLLFAGAAADAPDCEAIVMVAPALGDCP